MNCKKNQNEPSKYASDYLSTIIHRPAKLIKILFIFLLSLTLILQPFPVAFAEPQNPENPDQNQNTEPNWQTYREREEAQEDIRRQIEQLESEINAIHKQLSDVQKQISDMQRELEIAVEKYKETLDQVQRTRTRQEEIRLKKREVQNDLKKKEEVFSKRVKVLYKQGKLGYLEVLLNSTSFTDFLTRVRYIIMVTEEDSRLVDKIEEKKAKLEEIQSQLEQILKEEQEALHQMKVRRLSIEAEQQRLINFKESLSSDMKSLLERQQELIERERELYVLNIDKISNSYGLNVESDSIVETALQYLGIPYVWGGEDPDIGFDCSGLVRYVYLQHGISLPHYSGYQFNMGKEVDSNELQPGDLVFFGNPVHHIGIYAGNGYFIHAPQTGEFVKLTLLSSRTDFAGARRIIGYVTPSN